MKNVREIKGLGIKYDYPKRDEYETNDNINPLTEEETKDIQRYLEDGDADYEKLMSGDYILVAGNDTIEEIYGWKFAVGDSVTLHYHDGNKMAKKDVAILGILEDQFVRDYINFEGWFVMPEQAILKMVSYDSLNCHLLVSTETDKEAQIGEALAEITADRPQLSLETLAERRAYDEIGRAHV